MALDLVEDPGLNAEFEMVFLNTAQNDDQRGKLALENVKRAVLDAVGTFRAARPGSVVHSHSVQYPWPVAWRQVAIAVAARARGAAVLLHNHAQPPYMEPPGGWKVGRANRWAFAVLDHLVDANILIAAAGEPNLRQYMATVSLPVVHNSAVVGDILYVARSIAYGVAGRAGWGPFGDIPLQTVSLPIRPHAEVVTRYYMRLTVLDQPGVLAGIAKILGDHRVSIAAVAQKERSKGDKVPLVILTYEAKERDMSDAVRQIDALPCTKARTLLIRVEKGE